MQTQPTNFKKEITLIMRSLNKTRAEKAYDFIKLLYDEQLRDNLAYVERLRYDRDRRKESTAAKCAEHIAQVKGFIAYVYKKMDIEINNYSRCREISLLRQALSYLLRDKWNITLVNIGILLRPNKPFDHTTIIHNISKFVGLLHIKDSMAIAINQQIREAYLKHFNKQQYE